MLKKDKASKKALKPSELCRACSDGRSDEVHKLLRAPGIAAKINKTDEALATTPLLLTCSLASTSTSDSDLFNYLSICKMLLDGGADPTIGTYMRMLYHKDSNSFLKEHQQTQIIHFIFSPKFVYRPPIRL